MYWSRPGIVKSICNWDGLQNWPFGELICDMEFGGWDRRGFTVDYVSMPKAVEFGGGDTASAGDRFSEYRIKDWSVSRKLFFYSCCPEEPWPLIKFSFVIGRASSFYVRGFIMPVIVLTVMSFA